MAKPIQLPNGTWRIRWNDHDGVLQSETLETYKDADFRLREVNVTAERVRRKLAPAPVRTVMFNELSELWINKRTKNKRSPKDDHSILGCHLRPYFGTLAIDRIDDDRTDDYIDAKAHLSPKTIHNHLTLLISMLRLAHKKKLLTEAPSIRKPQLVRCPESYRYLKTTSEVQNFLRAARSISEFHHDLYALALLTGLRKGELVGLKFTDINFEQRLLVVQRSFDKPTKSGKVRHVPILDQALAILRMRKLAASSPFVFPRLTGAMLSEWAMCFEDDLHEALQRAGLPERTHNGRVQRYIVFHSLRHTFASHWVMNGGDVFKLQKILGHQSIEMTQRYAHLAPNAFAGDLSRLDGLGLAPQTEASILTLDRR